MILSYKEKNKLVFYKRVKIKKTKKSKTNVKLSFNFRKRKNSLTSKQKKIISKYLQNTTPENKNKKHQFIK